MPFKNLAQQTHDSLTRRAVALTGVKPLEVHAIKFRTGGIELGAEPAAIADRLRHWTKLSRRWIYVFDTTATQAERKALVESFSKARDGKTAKFRYARLNDIRGESSTLYIGSSESLRTRIRNHLGYAVGPSSLNMAYWVDAPDIEMRLQAARYPDSLSKEALCDLEDWLSVSLSPVFGKRGSV
ncbi:hypothetical protein [Variovorax paradoxus]|uniref:GIY-YIG domain-containing protein n=1 Tax=Variovorax paradoxus (strain EPS) TaxID=595537 RepID=E6V3Y4_VARPE|nr:hypothetical protein [Variovorax paradoxus]ADU38103.1 hypothetical protein Varpa_3930 [Variovorax paradoxus EPS]